MSVWAALLDKGLDQIVRIAVSSALICGLWATLWATDGQVVHLALPLTTQVPCTTPIIGDGVITASLVVPDSAPADLGVGVYVADRHGHWFRHVVPGALKPGRHAVSVPLATTAFIAEPGRTAWTDSTRAMVDRAGLFFWSARVGAFEIVVDGLRCEAPVVGAEKASETGCLTNLSVSASSVSTGARWSASLWPDPFPTNPFDPDQFSLDAIITQPDGGEQRVPGFYNEPMIRSDRGDREELLASGVGRFEVRYRPRVPGVYRVRLEARWRNGAPVKTDLPSFTATGAPWDGYVRTDAKDPRFLSRDGAFVWPIGPNLHSMPDRRSVERLSTVPTPNRGTLVYDALFARLAPQGVNAVEIWMSSWNFALEWRRDWSPYQGIGRYSQEHAWAIDHLLDRAQELGLTIKLVLDNHGKATDNVDAEWEHNPWNRALGGPIGSPSELFSDPVALAGQAKLRRYLVARYADHPALLTWKIWSEVNLCSANRALQRTWHEQASKHMHDLDIYRHPVSTHWSGDYHNADGQIVAQPGIDLVLLDAYHGAERELPDLLVRGLTDPQRRKGLGTLGKPIWISEYGAQWSAGDPDLMAYEHAIGPWLGLVTGYAGAPMLWWWEWVDQGSRFAPYRAISRFLIGEDLRSAEATSAALAATSSAGGLLSRCWVRPGRMLGYVLDSGWPQHPRDPISFADGRVVVGSAVGAGEVRVEWWDAQEGGLISNQTIKHPGGELTIMPPKFQRHIAFKLWRIPEAEKSQR